MSSRDNILSKIKQNQPGLLPLPDLSVLGTEQYDLVQKFTEILEGIGGKVLQVDDNEQIKSNHQLAYDAAEKLGVVPLLEAEDMLLCAPEPKSVQLYVSTIYTKLSK